MSKSRKKKDAAVGKQFKVGRFTVVVDDVLNEGGFAVIFLVHDEKGNRWAMKRIRLNNFRDFLQVRFEAETMRVMSQACSNVVRYVDDNLQEVSAAFRRSGKPHDSDKTYEVFILTEYYPRNVLQLINERLQDRRMLRESEVLQIFCDMCAAVGQMHARQPPIIHRDLKIENILISANGRYILCDFGSATNRILDPASDDINVIREELERYTTIAYRAPEMVNLYNMKTISTKADIWALGVLLYKLCFFNDPFGNSHLAIENAKYFIPAQHHYRPQVITLLRLCLNPDPALRPDVYQLAEAACEMSQRRCTVPNINNSPALDLTAAPVAVLSASPSGIVAGEMHADQLPKPSSSSNSGMMQSNAALTPRSSVTATAVQQQQPLEVTTSVAPRERPRAVGRSGKTPTNFALSDFSNNKMVAASSSPSSSSTTAFPNSGNTAGFAAEASNNMPLNAFDAVPPPLHDSLSSTNDNNSSVVADNTIVGADFEPEEDLLQLSDPNTASSASSSAASLDGGGGFPSTSNSATLTAAEFESYFNNPAYPDPFFNDADRPVPVPIAMKPDDDDEDEVNLINISSSPPPPLTPSIQRHIEQQYQFQLPSPKKTVSSNVFAPANFATSTTSVTTANTSVDSMLVSEKTFTVPILPHQHRNSLSLKKKPSAAAAAVRARAVTAQQHTESVAQPLVQSAAVRRSPPVHHQGSGETRIVSPTNAANVESSKKLPTTSSALQQQKGALSYERLDHDDDFSDDDGYAAASHAKRSVTNSGNAAPSLSSLSSSASSLTAAGGASSRQPKNPLGGFLQQNGMAFERSITTKNLSARNSTNKTNNPSFPEDGVEKYTPSSPEVSSSSSSSSSSSTDSSVNSGNSSDSGGKSKKKTKAGKNRKPKTKTNNNNDAAVKNKLSNVSSSSATGDTAERDRSLTGSGGQQQQSITRIDPPPSSSGLRRTHLQNVTAAVSAGVRQRQLSPSLVNSCTTAATAGPPPIGARSVPSAALRDAVRHQNSLATAAESGFAAAFQNMPTTVPKVSNDPFSNAPGFAAVFDRHGSSSVPPIAHGQPPRIASVLDSPQVVVGGSRSSPAASASAHVRAVSCNPFASAAVSSGGNASPHYVHSTPLVMRRGTPPSDQHLVSSSSNLSAGAANVNNKLKAAPPPPGFSLVSANSDVFNSNSNMHGRQHTHDSSSSSSAVVRAHKRGDSTGSVGLPGNNSKNNKFAVAAVSVGSERLSPR